MRQLFRSLSFVCLLAFVAAPAYAIDGCWVCRIDVYEVGASNVYCGYPQADSWGYDQCTLTRYSNRTECDTSGWACYYVEVMD